MEMFPTRQAGLSGSRSTPSDTSTSEDRQERANSLYSLSFFRFIFGLMMSIALIRFISKGWISEFYVKPSYFFTYYGFGWASPPAAPFIYIFFGMMLLLTVMISLGLLFRPAIILFFLLFTYAELWDKSMYLNHYYLISLLSFLMAFLPMSAVASLDCLIRKKAITLPKTNWSPETLLKIQIGSVYFLGGIAKIGYDWLVLGQPLQIWFSANSHIPVLGTLLTLPFMPLVVSWLAMFFDLSAPFLLFFRRTRPWIYPVVILFHTLTALLFPIGMFPWFMCTFSLVFFGWEWHRQVMLFIFRNKRFHPKAIFIERKIKVLPVAVLAGFFLLQLVMPFRTWFYPGNPLWHEQGFRFSWRIMLMEKNGFLEYQVRVKNTDRTFTVRPSEYLTSRQVQQMSFQPDMILQFAHHLRDLYKSSGVGDTEIRASSYVSLNGKGSRPLIDPDIDLASQIEGWGNKTWITR